MSESGGHNIYTLLTVIAIIVGVLFGIYLIKPSSFEAFGIKMKTGETKTNEILTKKNVEGNWKMTFDFERCSNPEFANKKFKCFYDIKLFQEGNTVRGTGNKHSESYEGRVTNYARKFPIKIEGKITGDH